MKPFLDCNIWSVSCHGIDEYYLVEKVYHYNSLSNTFIDIIPGHIQIPEFEIHDLNLLDQVDFNIVNASFIPIIKRTTNDRWSIDLKYYEQYNSVM